MTENLGEKSRLSVVSNNKEVLEKTYINNIVCSRTQTPGIPQTPVSPSDLPPDSSLTMNFTVGGGNAAQNQEDNSDFDASLMLNNFEEKVSKYCLSN